MLRAPLAAYSNTRTRDAPQPGAASGRCPNLSPGAQPSAGVPQTDGQAKTRSAAREGRRPRPEPAMRISSETERSAREAGLDTAGITAGARSCARCGSGAPRSRLEPGLQPAAFDGAAGATRMCGAPRDSAGERGCGARAEQRDGSGTLRGDLTPPPPQHHQPAAASSTARSGTPGRERTPPFRRVLRRTAGKGAGGPRKDAARPNPPRSVPASRLHPRGSGPPQAARGEPPRAPPHLQLPELLVQLPPLPAAPLQLHPHGAAHCGVARAAGPGGRERREPAARPGGHVRR